MFESLEQLPENWNHYETERTNKLPGMQKKNRRCDFPENGESVGQEETQK